MVDHFAILLAVRQRLLSLVVVTTGTTTLAATATGYTRAEGSFLADGFLVGMEVVPVGFASAEPGVVVKVEALTLTVDAPEREDDPAAPGRALTVGLPSLRAWENVAFEHQDGRWYVEEDYLPGPSFRAAGGANGEMEVQPAYVLKLGGLAGSGPGPLYRVSDAVLGLFPPGAAFAAADGHTVRVRGEPAPYRGQVLPEGASHALVVITVPMWVRTAINLTV
jgi:hypothetical protein